MNDRMDGRKVLVTQAEDYMGPAIAELFEAEGAQVTRVNGVVESVAQVATMLDEAGDLDVVIANLARDPTSTPVAESGESAELALFLASDKSNFIVGQVVPFAGGWVTST